MTAAGLQIDWRRLMVAIPPIRILRNQVVVR
jgi:hypothetical protein